MNLNRKIHVLMWGTYDSGKPRNRLLIHGLRQYNSSVSVEELHVHIWKSIEDKSVVGSKKVLQVLLPLFLIYPYLLCRLLTRLSCDVIVVGYGTVIDTLILWPFAYLFKKPIIVDAYISLYDTIVNDRKRIPPLSIQAALLYSLEWLSLHCATHVLVDTEAQKKFYCHCFGLSQTSVSVVWVGVETEYFPSQKADYNLQKKNSVCTVLFYGQFIPLHGIEVIVRAAELASQEQLPIEWIIIGKGQESPAIDRMIRQRRILSITRIEWVEYKSLYTWIQQADICLGIFGITQKAQRVIPNKLYQICAMGKPLVTADTQAIAELIQKQNGIYLIPPGNPLALKDAVWKLYQELNQKGSKTLDLPVVDKTVVGSQFITSISKVVSCMC